MILFLSEGCGECERLKRWLQAAGVELDAVPGLTVYDYGTVDGAAEADFHNVLRAPTLVEWRDARNWCCTSDVAEIVALLKGAGDEG